MSDKQTATRLLTHYLRLSAQRAGVQWDSDNDAEVASIVDALITAARQEAVDTIAEAMRKADAAMCPACGVRVAGASGLCGECAQEAGRLSGAQVQAWLQAREAEEDARIDAELTATQDMWPERAVTLRYVAEVKDALTDCDACATQIGVLLWVDGRPFVQTCPACGAVLRAWQNAEGDVIAALAD